MTNVVPTLENGSIIDVSEENGFRPTNALPVTRFYLPGEDYIAWFGERVTSLEGEQTVTKDCVVMFDDVDRMIGYPASMKAFGKYVVEQEHDGRRPGKATKYDNTVYLAKQFTDQTFKSPIWNGDIIESKIGDWLVANPANNDYRIIDAEVFKYTYEVI